MPMIYPWHITIKGGTSTIRRPNFVWGLDESLGFSRLRGKAQSHGRSLGQWSTKFAAFPPRTVNVWRRVLRVLMTKKHSESYQELAYVDLCHFLFTPEIRTSVPSWAIVAPQPGCTCGICENIPLRAPSTPWRLACGLPWPKRGKFVAGMMYVRHGKSPL